jgi:hypothetical protein
MTPPSAAAVPLLLVISRPAVEPGSLVLSPTLALATLITTILLFLVSEAVIAISFQTTGFADKSRQHKYSPIFGEYSQTQPEKASPFIGTPTSKNNKELDTGCINLSE